MPTKDAAPTGTVTFLYTDIEGSTRLAREYPEALPRLLARHHDILTGAVQANGGHVMRTVGDAFCVAFHTAGNALHAAVQAQQDLYTEAWEAASVKVRMGIHTGRADVRADGEYEGYLTLSHVQRLMSAAHGGQVLISAATEQLVRDELPAGV